MSITTRCCLPAPLRLSVLLIFLLACGPMAAKGMCTATDLARAHERNPRPGWKGSDFQEMSRVLTAKLSESGHRVKACDEWTVSELKALQRVLFSEADSALLHVYEEAGMERRRRRFSSLPELEAHWERLDSGGLHPSQNVVPPNSAAANTSDALATTRRDGLCHETVMWFVHHLTVEAQRRLTALGHYIPSLPLHDHSTATADRGDAGGIQAEYVQQVSCQQCHTGTIIDPKWQDATLPKPLPVDPSHPGRERQRACDFQADPPCGPCEGLGGVRWGDGAEEMTPMRCEVLHGPEVPPKTRGRYPELGVASMSFATRSPVAVKPEGDATYVSLNGSLTLGWSDGVMRMRYDGAEFSAIYLQTRAQAVNMDPGVSASITAQGCSCDRSIAGVMHTWSFDPADSLDPLDLPPEKGGAAYLGAVSVQLDGDGSPLGRRNATADHFMKWAFHFLVDADESSPSFGLPLRLYAPWGVRQVFESWSLGDPTMVNPDVWKLPEGCAKLAPGCSAFEVLSTPSKPSDESHATV